MTPFANFRDMGGIECPRGKIKRGMIFRSPKLVPENDEQKAFLDSLELDRIIDLRSSEEKSAQPDYVPAGCEYIFAPALKPNEYKYIIVTTRAKLRCLFLKGKKAGRPVEEKARSYRELPLSVEAYSKLFECMDKGQRFVFHCTEGKDRTGIAAALIEFALGRNYDTVLKEYLLSNTLRPSRDRSSLKYLGAGQKIIDAIIYCEQTHKEMFDLSVGAMKKNHGSVREFLEKEYGVTPERVERWSRSYLE